MRCFAHDVADDERSDDLPWHRRNGLYLSALRDDVEALGGRLEVTAVFPEVTFSVTTELSDR